MFFAPVWDLSRWGMSKWWQFSMQTIRSLVNFCSRTFYKSPQKSIKVNYNCPVTVVCRRIEWQICFYLYVWRGRNREGIFQTISDTFSFRRRCHDAETNYISRQLTYKKLKSRKNFSDKVGNFDLSRLLTFYLGNFLRFSANFMQFFLLLRRFWSIFQYTWD